MVLFSELNSLPADTVEAGSDIIFKSRLSSAAPPSSMFCLVRGEVGFHWQLTQLRIKTSDSEHSYHNLEWGGQGSYNYKFNYSLYIFFLERNLNKCPPNNIINVVGGTFRSIKVTFQKKNIE